MSKAYLSPPRGIEVERKYLPPDADALSKRVTELGGESLGQIRFTDTYYDTIDCLLASKDEWLRQRDDAWELKIPTGEESRSGGERTSFREIEGGHQVGLELRRRHGFDLKENELCPLLLKEKCGIIPFASFETVRAKFKLRGLALDLDLASFGHGVLEIELMVDSPERIYEAEQQISQIAKEIGVQPLSGSQGGKLETYIRRYKPKILENLIDAGILSPS